MDILKFLFYGVILTFPFGEVLRWQLGNGIAFTINDILVIIFGLLYFVKSKSNLQYKFVIPFLISIVFSLLLNISKLNAFELFISSLYPIRWFLYLQLFFYVKDYKKKYEVIKLLFIAEAIYLILGFTQYFYYTDLHNLFYLGWDAHMYRLFSTILDPNFAGAIYVLFLVFNLGIIFKAKERVKYLLVLLIFLLMIATFLTYSRSAMTMLVVSTFTYLILIKKTKLFAVLILAIISFYIFVSPYFNIESINPFRSFSSVERIKSAKIATDIFKENPIFGVGFNSYRYAQIRYGFRHGSIAQVSHADASTDNSFLFVLATTGILGFLSFIYFWKKVIEGSTTIAISLIVGIFVDSLFVNSLFFTFTIELLWILTGLSVSKKNI